MLCSSPPLHPNNSTPSQQWTHVSIAPALWLHILRSSLSIISLLYSEERTLIITYNAWEERNKSRVCRVRGTQARPIQHLVLFPPALALVQYADFRLGATPRKRSKDFRVPATGATRLRREGTLGQKANLADARG